MVAKILLAAAVIALSSGVATAASKDAGKETHSPSHMDAEANTGAGNGKKGQKSAAGTPVKDVAKGAKGAASPSHMDGEANTGTGGAAGKDTARMSKGKDTASGKAVDTRADHMDAESKTGTRGTSKDKKY